MSRVMVGIHPELKEQIKILKKRIYNELGVWISNTQASRILAHINKEVIKNFNSLKIRGKRKPKSKEYKLEFDFKI